MSCGKPPYYWECPDCGTNLTRQGETSVYSTFYCDNCGLAFCIDNKGRFFEDEDDAAPLKFKQMEYVDISDICRKFNIRIRDLAFIYNENYDNGDFVWFPCDENAIEEYKESAEDMAGSRYKEKYINSIMLADYLTNELGIKDGVMVHIHW